MSTFQDVGYLFGRSPWTEHVQINALRSLCSPAEQTKLGGSRVTVGNRFISLASFRPRQQTALLLSSSRTAA